MNEHVSHRTPAAHGLLWLGINGGQVAEVRLENVALGRELTAVVGGEQVFIELFGRHQGARVSEARMKEFIGVLMSQGWRTAHLDSELSLRAPASAAPR
jgi:hypothetical protein